MKSSTPAPDIENFVRAAIKGDEAAIAQLIRATEHRLLRFCVYLCGNREVAQDICQEAYLKAFKSLSNLEKPSSFLDWLFRIAKNAYLDSVRNQTFTVELTEAEGIAADAADPQLVLAVQQVLSQFEPEDRTLLIIIEIERYAYSEAAEIIGISEDAVRSRLHRLRKIFLEKWHALETK